MPTDSIPCRQGILIAFCLLQGLAMVWALSWMMSDDVVTKKPVKSAPKHSTYLCVGENYHTDSWKYKSCHFQDICYDGTNFSFYIDPQYPISIPAVNELAVSVSTLGVTHSAIKFAPEVVVGSFPHDPVWADEIDDTDLHVLAVEYNGSNFGHVLGDSLLPWWRLLDMFGLMEGDYPFRPIHMMIEPPFTYSCEWQIRAGWISDMSFCGRLYEKIAQPFSHRALVFLQQHYSMATNEKPICFQNLVTGIGMLSDHGHDHSVHGRNTEALDIHMVGGGPILWKFRSLYMQRIGLSSTVKPIPGLYDVVFVDRSSAHRSWFDTHEAYSRISERVAPIGAHVSSPIDFSKLTIKEQIEIVSRTQVLICFPGGSSYIALFLPRGATLIFVFALSHLSDGRQDYPLHNNMAHIHVRWLEGQKGENTGQVFYNVTHLEQEVELALVRARRSTPPL